MVEPLEVLALVPARGGSKSIPGKNIRLLAGHPLMAYSIAAGLQANSVTRVIVSTDDEEVAKIAVRYGAEVPFMRPPDLAADDTPDLPVFQHALTWLEGQGGYRPDVIVQLRPTSPVRPLDCVDRAVKLLLGHPEADSVRGVVPCGQNPYKMWSILENGRLEPLLSGGFNEPYNMPRQKLPPTYWQSGHIDVIRPATILEKGSMSGEVILPLILDPKYTVDIDNLGDWHRTEWMLLHNELDFVCPGTAPRPLPEQVKLLILDFDGVLTDNRVWVDAGGRELVAAHRGDGWGLAQLKERGIEVAVLSTETHPVVAARCRKLDLPVVQGISDKASALKELLEERGVDPAHVIYLGNDVNDLPCFPLVACALVVADAHPKARAQADLVLKRSGGLGAVRELCDLLLDRLIDEENND
ncbi:MAG: acylneuraminate cytidylyltransferase [Anaerolineales bacterium]|nr:MAG: acylneuraminate cytidylyltransferase [Anaerolineales bacterium]